MMVDLVKELSAKMKGFSRNETVAYYKDIMERAWAQVEAAETPEVKSETFDKYMEWTMLDKDYDDRTRRVFTGPVFVPTWWGHYDPTYHPAPVSSGPTPVSLPSGGRRGRRFLAIPAGVGLRCLDGERRAELLQQRDRQRQRVHQLDHQPHQPGAGSHQFWRLRSERRAAAPAPAPVQAAPAPARAVGDSCSGATHRNQIG